MNTKKSGQYANIDRNEPKITNVPSHRRDDINNIINVYIAQDRDVTFSKTEEESHDYV